MDLNDSCGFGQLPRAGFSELFRPLRGCPAVSGCAIHRCRFFPPAERGTVYQGCIDRRTFRQALLATHHHRLVALDSSFHLTNPGVRTPSST